MRTEAVLIGPIRQEILSGVRDPWQYDQLRTTLRAFEDLSIETGEYELAAELSNECLRHGVRGSTTDYLICAVSLRNKVAIFTCDRDFWEYARHIDIRLHELS